MDVNNAKSQMRKGMLEYCILLLLKRQAAYASDIIQQLKEADLLVVEGTLTCWWWKEPSTRCLRALRRTACLPTNGKRAHKGLHVSITV